MLKVPAARFRVIAVTLVLLTTALVAPVVVSRSSVSRPTHAGGALVVGSLAFERNDGQHPSDDRFVARGAGYMLAMQDSQVVLALSAERDRTELAMTFDGARPGVRPRGDRPATGRVNYFVGGEPHAWRTDVPTFERVRYPRLYEGIDLLFYGNGRQLEYDIVVAPGARPDAARLRFAGARSLRVAEDGSLALGLTNGDLRYTRPSAYQLKDGIRQGVEVAYRIDGDVVTFEPGEYDRSIELVIDPVLMFSTYLGGSSVDSVEGVAVDAAGAAYVTGSTRSSDFPISPNAPQSELNFADAFVTKFNRDGAIVYSTYFGGENSANGTAIAVDPAGGAYAIGITNSRNLPVTSGAFQPQYGGGDTDIYVLKLAPAGNRIVYASYLGGSNDEPDSHAGIAVDPTGVATVVSSTTSLDFPTTAGALQREHSDPDSSIAFATRINAAGTGLVFSTLLTGAFEQDARGVALDAQGRAIVVGSTRFEMTTTKTVGPLGQQDGYALKLNKTGSALVFSTRFGGGGDDVGGGVTYDPNRDVAFVTGTTDSADFPAAGIQGRKGPNDAFLLTITADGSSGLYSALLGGSNAEEGLAIGSSGDVITLFGTTTSVDFPTLNPLQPAKGRDAFVTRLRGSANILFSTTVGGASGEDLAFGVIDGAGAATIGGTTYSSDFPLAHAADASAGNLPREPEGFVSRVAMVPRGTPGPHDIVVHVANAATLHGDWEKVADSSAAGGARLHNPDRGRAKVTTPAASPTDYFEFTVHGLDGGPYRLWLRGKADGGAYTNDSVWVQFERAQNVAPDADDEHDIFRIGTTEAMAVVVEDCSGCGLHGWGWQDGAYGQKLLGPGLYFNSDSAVTIRVQRREDGISIDQIVLAKDDVGTGSHFTDAPGYQKDDDTIVAAQDPFSGRDVVVHLNASNTIRHGSWIVVADSSAADGVKVRNPDQGAPKLLMPLATPTDYIDVLFHARAGVGYRIWMRGRADANFYVNDSAYVQFSDSVDSSGTTTWRIGTPSATPYVLEDCSGCGVQAWGWNDNGYGTGVLGPLVHFASDGDKTLRIQTREDGLSIDQIVLSASRYLAAAPGKTKNDTTIVRP